MADEPLLPPLPAISWSPGTQTIRTRKRDRDDTAPPHPSTSSDPAWFSSDDDPSVDNYTHTRRKKRYMGSWFSQHPSPSDLAFSQEYVLPKPTSKRSLQRQYDSGVWMGSDAAADDCDDVPEELPTPTRPGFSLPKRLSRSSVSSAEEVARAQIRHCLDNAEENVDLTDLGLHSISNETISQLSEFTCIPIVEREVAFEQKEPSLKLYLARNSLDRVPGAVFDLDHLSVLSLRGNDLVELVPAVSKLENLEELNVSQNSLRYLPGDLLRLLSPPGKLKKFLIHPNPFCHPKRAPPQPKPNEDSEDEEAAEDGEDKQAAEEKIFDDILKERLSARLETYNGYTARILTRSPVQYNDSTGTPYSHFKIPSPGDIPSEIATEPLNLEPIAPVSLVSKGSGLSNGPRRSAVPSLFELSLVAGYKTSQLSAIPDYLSEDAPQYVHSAVLQAIGTKEEGGRCCCVCKRAMIVPRAAWLEWWEVGKVTLGGENFSLEPLSKNEDERAVPFLKQGCSWACIPKKVENRDWLVGGNDS